MSADFDFITPRLATGGGLEVRGDAEELVAAGITHCLDLTDGENDALLLTGLPVAYLWNATADDGSHKPPDWFERSLAFALPMFAIAKTKLYAHCSAGVNRGPSTAFAVLRALGWTDEAAFALLKAKRPQVNVAYRADANEAVKVLGFE